MTITDPQLRTADAKADDFAAGEDGTTNYASDHPSTTQQSDPEKGAAGAGVPRPSFPGSDAPDGGIVAWLVVLGAWCTSFCSFGWVNSMSYLM